MALNTIGEELFATTFVAVLAKVSSSITCDPQISSPGRVSRYLSFYDIVESVCRLLGPVLLGGVVSWRGFAGCERVLVTCFVGEEWR